ncbi:putative ABC transport system permease protein [Streptacidiphilus sp. MAP12-33]|uniref:FtsX-like permease family protein n=1 Tax=Streptacidiphilus sp. MAP12-33 TaxID=3156266 RepID=UPI003515FC26
MILKGAGFSSWRVALRLARRNALRAKARSLLVIAMIALPVAGVSAADIVNSSSTLTVGQQLDRRLGAAQAMVQPVQPGSPIVQLPDGSAFAVANTDANGTPQPSASPGGPRPVGPGALDQLRAALPRGARLVPDDETPRQVTTVHGEDTTRLVTLDAADPAARGIVTLRAGRLPHAVGEALATSGFLAASGLSVGDTTADVATRTRFTITGVAEFPADLAKDALVAAPRTTAPITGASAGSDWWTGGDALVVLPAGAPFTWAQVEAADHHGYSVVSRAVGLTPPPADQVPYYRSDSYAGGGGLFDDWTATAATVVSGMALLEVVLLAGPAFAVGARRTRRELGLLAAAGGSRAHVRRVVLAGGAVLGGVGAVLGVLFGGLAVALARDPIERSTGARFGGYVLRPAELLGVLAVGLVTGLLAALIPAVRAGRAPVLASLSGHAAAGPPRRLPTVVGLAALVAGTATAFAGATVGMQGTWILAGSIVAELGLVICTPSLIGLLGRLGRRLPLSPRLALRDAARHPGRTAPAVAAVLAAAAGAVAVLVYVSSSDAEARAQFPVAMPLGGVALLDPDAPTLSSLPDQAAAVEGALPGIGPRAAFQRVIPGPDCGQRSSEGAASCGEVGLLLPPAQRCPAGGGAQDATPSDPRCHPPTALRLADVVAGDAGTLRALTGSTDPAAVRALLQGKVVLTDARYLDRGEAILGVGDPAINGADPNAGPDGTGGAPTVRLPAVVVSVSSAAVGAVIPESALHGAGLTEEPMGYAWLPPYVPSTAQAERALAAVDAYNPGSVLQVQHPFQPRHGALELVLVAAAVLVAVGASALATGLAAADAQDDLAILAAVGAPPRTRRRLSGFQCAVIAAMGTLLGAVSGLVPAAALWESRYISVHEGGEVVVPWGSLALLVVCVPALAWVLAALSTRPRRHLLRRPT